MIIGWKIINGSDAEPIYDTDFEIPSKEDEQILVHLISEELRKEIEEEIKNNE